MLGCIVRARELTKTCEAKQFLCTWMDTSVGGEKHVRLAGITQCYENFQLHKQSVSLFLRLQASIGRHVVGPDGLVDGVMVAMYREQEHKFCSHFVFAILASHISQIRGQSIDKFLLLVHVSTAMPFAVYVTDASRKEHPSHRHRRRNKTRNTRD